MDDGQSFTNWHSEILYHQQPDFFGDPWVSKPTGILVEWRHQSAALSSGTKECHYGSLGDCAFAFQSLKALLVRLEITLGSFDGSPSDGGFLKQHRHPRVLLCEENPKEVHYQRAVKAGCGIVLKESDEAVILRQVHWPTAWNARFATRRWLPGGQGLQNKNISSYTWHSSFFFFSPRWRPADKNNIHDILLIFFLCQCFVEQMPRNLPLKKIHGKRNYPQGVRYSHDHISFSSVHIRGRKNVRDRGLKAERRSFALKSHGKAASGSSPPAKKASDCCDKGWNIALIFLMLFSVEPCNK